MAAPLLFEVNTRCWLSDLSSTLGKPVTLSSVPPSAFLRWRELGFTHIWLMGVWSTGERARAEALKHESLRERYSEALPDWRAEDVRGSPYAVADYHVPAALGGDAGLQVFRKTLRAHGLKLILDFVPNHLGLDHPWVRERSGIFVQGPSRRAGAFAQETPEGIRWLAHGRDPFFDPWTDTVQLDYRLSRTRLEMSRLLSSVAARCDGLRCDMAMLILESVFARTWEGFPPTGPTADGEFWQDAILRVKQEQPGFLFLAEVYWGLEPKLRELGFDYAYDKPLYDALIGSDPAAVQRRLFEQSREELDGGVHFLENHDELRVASLLKPEAQRAAALVTLGLPGMRFLHEGQLTGRRRQVPVQLSRRPNEPDDPEITLFYDKLLRVLGQSAIGRGRGDLLHPRPAWADNPTAAFFVLVLWQGSETEFDLVAVNLAPHRSQCYAPLSVQGIEARDWNLSDGLGSERYHRWGTDLATQGLYLDLPPHGAQVFRFHPAE